MKKKAENKVSYVLYVKTYVTTMFKTYTKRRDVNQMLTVLFLGTTVVFFLPAFLYFPTISKSIH